MSTNLTLNIEQIKKDKDGLDVLSDIYIYAVLGESVSNEDLIRFQWYGVYEQEDAKNYFKLKIPLSLGQLNLEQIKTLSFISKEYAKNSLDFSKEQKIELKWIRIHDLPHIFNLLHTVDLNTIFEAGHTVRNVITCPINSIDNPQIVDVSSLAQKLDETFVGNKKYSNLPNALQMGISGWSNGCVSTDVAHVNFDAFKNNKNKILYSVKILKNHIGFITTTQVLPMAKAIARLYKEYGNREDVNTSDFEAFVNSWGQEKFFDLLESMINFNFKEEPFEYELAKNSSDHFGIHKSKDSNKSYIGCKVETKDFGSAGFDKLASLLEKYEASKVKVTNKGHLIVIDAPTSTSKDFASELKKIGLNPFI